MNKILQFSIFILLFTAVGIFVSGTTTITDSFINITNGTGYLNLNGQNQFTIQNYPNITGVSNFNGILYAQANNFSDIIAKAASCGTGKKVVIPDGIYNYTGTAIQVPAGCMIEGTGTNAIINNPNITYDISGVHTTMMNVSDDTILKNLQFRGINNGTTSLYISGNRALVTGNYFNKNGEGIYTIGTIGGRIEANEFYHDYYNTSLMDDDSGQYGILLSDNTAQYVIVGNRFTQGKRSIYVLNADYNTITGNFFNLTGAHRGVYINHGSSYNTVSGNTFLSGLFHAVSVQEADTNKGASIGNTIIGNSFFDQSSTAILIAGENNQTQHTLISGNNIISSGRGISLNSNNVTDTVIIGNHINVGASGSGIQDFGIGTLVIGNQITGSTSQNFNSTGSVQGFDFMNTLENKISIGLDSSQLENNLVEFYSFSENGLANTQSRVYDSSRYRDFAVMQNTSVICTSGAVDCPYFTTGVKDTGLHFDRIGDRVVWNTAPTFDLTGTGGMTISLWTFPNTITSGQQTYVGRSNQQFQQTFANDNTYHPFLETNTNNDACSSSGTITADRWNHIAVTVLNGKCHIYIDGEDTPMNDNNVTNNVTFNQLGMAGTITAGFNGTMDEVRIYNRSLSAAEIRALYNGNGKIGIESYLQKNTTWSYLQTFPAACPAGSYLSALGTSTTCTSITTIPNNNTVGTNNNAYHIIGSNTTAMTCEVSTEGALYYDNSTHKHYGCNSTNWNALY